MIGSDNERIHALPPSLARTWPVLLVVGCLIAGGEVWNRLWGPWLNQTFSFAGFGHNNPGLLLVFAAGYFLIVVWIAAAVRSVLWPKGAARQTVGYRFAAQVGALGLLFVVPLAPAGSLEVPFVMAFGPGQGAGEFLSSAASTGNRSLADAVLKRGADVDSVSASGQTALQRAASAGNPDFVFFLIQQGADVNARGPLGFTALINAVNNSRVDTVRLLLKHGSNPRAVTDDGRSVLDFAIQAGNAEVIDAIRSARQ